MSLNHLLGRSHWQRPQRRPTGSVYLPLAAATLYLILICGIAPAATLDADSMQSTEERISKGREECEDGVDAADAGRWEEAEFRWLKAVAIVDLLTPQSPSNNYRKVCLLLALRRPNKKRLPRTSSVTEAGSGTTTANLRDWSVKL